MDNNMMNKLTRYRFEAAVQDATEFSKEYLRQEYIDVLESNKPYQKKCDYIGFSLLSIEEKISLLDDEIQNLKDYKQRLKEAQEIALCVGAKVFSSYGITKIEGAGISSITVTNATQTSKLELTVLNEEAFIQQGFYKKVLDEKKILEYYANNDYKEFILEHASVEPVIYIKPSRLRINKRRSANSTTLNNISDAAWGVINDNYKLQ